ncbi:methyltransferase domain-containing protein [Actinomadura xylanilytica]|uniref:methyltransferase domain-containing protein n=1 Tax=Actinomadura xylanilytica TaxID=887459 RepID=UPI00255AD05C|nr:methyltransferase domain-containing protein [Actinomadura xylanilytica]MDL4776703.1 class I SAM-dependent methyltransferase [Actinomadura xylanilytica]
MSSIAGIEQPVPNEEAGRMTMEAARERQRVEWALCASAWRRHRTSFTEPGREITERMLRLAAPRAGQRVLDLACGVGNPAFDLARLVGPEGRVLGLDLSGPMVAEARTLAAELGAANVEFRTIPGEHELGVPAGGFDVATCRAGLQYMPDRRGAVHAVLAALRPGGRFVAMTLGSAERCMPFQLTNGIVSRHVPLPTGGDDGDGPVALSSPADLAGLLTGAGFTGVRTEVFEAPIFEAPDPAAAWALFTETAGPFIQLLSSLPDETRRAIDEDAERTFAKAFPDGPVRPTGEILLVSGDKPE